MDLETLRKTWSLLERPERRAAIWVLLLMSISAFSSAVMVGSVLPFLSVLASPAIIKEATNLAWAYEMGGFQSDYAFLFALGIAAFIIIVTANLLLFFNNLAMTWLTETLAYSISTRLLAKYLSQPYEFFISRHSGDMSSNILAEVAQLVSQFIRPFAGFVSSALMVAAILGTLIIVAPLVTIFAVGGLLILYAILLKVVRAAVGAMGQRRAEANKRKFRIAAEALGGIKDIKLAGREQEYLARFRSPSLEIAGLQTRVALISNAPQFALQTVAFGGIILLCLAMLSPEKLQDRATLGNLLPLLGILAFAGQRLFPQLQALYSSLTTMTYGRAAVERVHNDLGGSDTSLILPYEASGLGLNSSVHLKNIQYFYPGAEKPDLKGVTLEIRAGERLGIVGASGAGKTTLADVVLGLLTPSSGEIVVDGQTITQQNLRHWQRSVGYVPQEIFLVDASISENIALGVPVSEIEQKKIERAASIAQLHEFIVDSLPNGYQTLVGERGVRLSGGQRQRIGIARALYNDADLVVFDEATSALDNMTEREVMAAVEAMPGDKTILMIAHRLSTVRVCDRIAVMEKGTIVDCDTWDILMKTSYVFRQISEAA